MREGDGALVDRAKLRAYARELELEHLLVWLDRAIERLPEAELPRLFEDYAGPEEFLPDGLAERGLLGEVRRFHAESLAGRYYESFAVDSRNFRQRSRGTARWIAEHTRLMSMCLQAEEDGDLETAREGLGLLIDLLRSIDRAEVEFVFFADEPGSWQVGVDWRRVFPAWFRCLATLPDAYDFAEAVVDAINDFAFGKEKAEWMAVARELATPLQSEALSDYACNLT